MDFPSQTIPGLTFIRERGHMRGSNETIYVNWYAADRGSRFRFDLGRILGISQRRPYSAAR